MTANAITLSPYLSLYATSPSEHDQWLSPSRGQVPVELEGALYRNGPARWSAGDFYAHHLFDGDGMVARFHFSQGKVHYRSRYVQTPKYRAGNEGKALRGLGSERPGGPLANAFRRQADRANTHAVVHAGKLLALTDDGRPWELDSETLETLGHTDFNGRLSRNSLFSTHPRLDPKTGELFNFGLVVPGRRSLAALRCYRIDPSGHLYTLATLPLNHLYVNHDFVITENYLVFVLAPLIVDPVRAVSTLLGLKTFEAASGYHDRIGTRIILVPRNGDKPRQLECPPLVYVHFNNAFEQQGDVVIDLIRHADWDVLAGSLRHFRTEPVPSGTLTRLRVSPRNQVEVENLCPLTGEFAQHDTRCTGYEYRYSYLPTQQSRALTKVDQRTNGYQIHPFGPLDLPGEPVFVPRRATADEDDGWLLLLVYRHTEHRTDLVIVDARDLEADAVAVLPLPEPVFPGFHGSFVPV